MLIGETIIFGGLLICLGLFVIGGILLVIATIGRLILHIIQKCQEGAYGEATIMSILAMFVIVLILGAILYSLGI